MNIAVFVGHSSVAKAGATAPLIGMPTICCKLKQCLQYCTIVFVSSIAGAGLNSPHPLYWYTKQSAVNLDGAHKLLHQ